MSFESFREELALLLQQFSEGFHEYQRTDYSEAKLRDDFLNPFFEALGWDMRNKGRLIQSKREVEIESITRIGSGKKRADYLFRIDGRERFVCEAKKPSATLDKGPIFQAKRYAWNKDVPLAILSDFEEIKLYIVSIRPDSENPSVGEYKVIHYTKYLEEAKFLWDLLAKENVQAGSIDRMIDSLPKKAAKGKGKMRQGYLIKPDRTRALDADFLNFLDEARQKLASSLYANNDHEFLMEHGRLNEATQKILDRLLFLRICEDREIDTGAKLETIAGMWQNNTSRPVPERKSMLNEDRPEFKKSTTDESLYRRIARHFRELDRRPAGLAPFFNGNLFKPHFSEDLEVDDEFMRNFIDDLSDENSPYLFNVIPVEILGTIYERFLGKVVRPQGRGVTVEEKPEVRKAGGVYYTPRYIVDYIVEQTVGKLVENKPPERTLELRILDPACGSGSFLIRAFERMCEHWQQVLTNELAAKEKKEELTAWKKKHRSLCWVDDATNDVHLTVDLKRRILTSNIYGVDLDGAAVEVTQLSLYLKMLENENRTTLERERELFQAEAMALLPGLENNIKCGNSLIASDFSMVPEDIIRIHAFDWPVQFAQIMKNGGFDAVVGNPPYGANSGEESAEYLREKYEVAGRNTDTYALFMEQAFKLARPGGYVSMIVPTGWYSGAKFPALRKFIACNSDPVIFVNLPYDVFSDAWVDTTVFSSIKRQNVTLWPRNVKHLVTLKTFSKRQKIQNLDEFDQDTHLSDFSEWFSEGNDIFLTYADSQTTALMRKLERIGRPFSMYSDIQRGVTPFNLTDTPTHESSLRAFSGTVRRYQIEEDAVRYVRFDDTLAEPKPIRYFQGPRLLIRELISRQFQIQAVKVSDDFITNKSMQSALPISGGPDVCFLLGCFNSRLLSWYFLQKSNIAQRDDFPKIVLKETRSLPFPKIDLNSKVDKARHDKLVEVVCKMLALTPKLRAAQSDAEKATLQNAVTATDQQIDQLVYELYGLTPEEIAIVEGEV